MGRRRNRNKFKQKAITKAYFRPRRVTVGMLEDACAQIRDKSTVVQISDRSGQYPEPVLRALLIAGKDGGAEGIVLAAKFSWTGSNDEDDEVDPTEDAVPIVPNKDACAYAPPSPSDCVTIGKGMKYMGVRDDAPKAESSNAKP